MQYEVAPAKMAPGVYRNVTGNQALALGLVAAGVKSGLPLFLGAYPITPASGILEELAGYKHFGVRTFQAEDEIAAVGAALGASFGGSLAISTSSGPGIVLKQEAIGLAVTLELPLVILDIQRAGPATGMPTKPEQGDLLNVMFGRNSESPVPVIAAATPGDCFDATLEACRIALTYRTPVFMLSDAYLANGSEPWLIPDPDSIPEIEVEFATEPNQDGAFMPYLRDPQTLARPWAVPGTPGPRAPDRRPGEGGRDRQRLVRPGQPRLHGPDPRAEGRRDRRARPRGRPRRGREAARPRLGRTYGPITAAVQKVRAGGGKVAQAHLRHLNPFPRNLGDVLRSYDRVLVPEMNLGQLLKLVRAEFLVDAAGYNRCGLRSPRPSWLTVVEAMTLDERRRDERTAIGETPRAMAARAPAAARAGDGNFKRGNER